LASEKKKEVSPERAAQAARMKERLEQLAAKRKEREQAIQKGAGAGGAHLHGGVGAAAKRSGRRGNR
jgi:hypothetical protein